MCGNLWPHLFCHFANKVTDRISSIGNIVYNLNWFSYPLDVQESIIFIIRRSKQPLYFTGLGMIWCTLEVFGNVMSNFFKRRFEMFFSQNCNFFIFLQLVKKSFSFYVIFRGLTQHWNGDLDDCIFLSYIDNNTNLTAFESSEFFFSGKWLRYTLSSIGAFFVWKKTKLIKFINFPGWGFEFSLCKKFSFI